ncbi:MAG: protein kinase [Oscillatoria princeps RMCB-10]|jgi:serine/threonine protein kinase|nr:protein kinase [Oscillatoria princeps RMCB-10]
MSDYPDFSSHGYQVLEANGRNPVLGHNNIGGRVTYLAVNTKTQQPVVIKQFQFAQLGANWGEYNAIEREIKVLRRLKHPSIPRYLDFFQTAGGFCMVQEYKDAESAATSRSFSPQEIKQIAISVLEILVYLQSMKQPVIHRDIKPENILIDGQMKVYLVDFGFARMGGGEVAASSVVKGSLGFMPPEQLFNRQLTEASDLYGLGATLICLLTGTKSADIGNLIDERYGIHFQHLVPPQDRGWLNWLEKMVEPRPQDRYANAAEALAALKPLDVSRLPKVRVSWDKVELQAVELGEKLRQTITVSNPIPETVLAGRWEVAPHESDPPHTPYDHAWIFFEPVKFEGNMAVCEITVDTSQLLEDLTYTRQVFLRTNSQPDTYPIAIEVKTAPLPKFTISLFLKLLLFRLFFIILFFIFGYLFIGYINALNIKGFVSELDHLPSFVIFMPSLVAGFIAAHKTMIGMATGAEFNGVGVLVGASNGTLLGSVAGFIAAGGMVSNSTNGQIASLAGSLVGAVMGALTGAFLGGVMMGCLTWIFFQLFSGWLAMSLLPCILKPVPFDGSGGEGIVNALVGIVLIGISLLFLWFVNPCISAAVCIIVYFLVLFQIEECNKYAVDVAFLWTGFSITLGAEYQLFSNVVSQQAWVEPLEMAVAAAMAIAGLSATAIPLISLMVKRSIMIDKYLKSEPYLIKP